MSTPDATLRSLAFPLKWLLLHFHALLPDWALDLVLLLVLLKMVIPWVLLLPFRPAMKLLENYEEARKELERRAALFSPTELQRQLLALHQAHVQPHLQWQFRWLQWLGRLLTLIGWYVGLVFAYLLLKRTPELCGTRFLWAADMAASDPFYVLPLLVFLIAVFSMRSSSLESRSGAVTNWLLRLLLLGRVVLIAVLPVGLSFYLLLSVFWVPAWSLVLIAVYAPFAKISRLRSKRNG